MPVYAVPTDKPFETTRPLKTRAKESEFSKECQRLLEENNIQVFLNEDGEPVTIITSKQ